MSVDKILDDRHDTYGTFRDLAEIAVDLRNVLLAHLIYKKARLPADCEEALTHICTKMARVVNGDPSHVDSWRDIAGYATLVADRLEGKSR